MKKSILIQKQLIIAFLIGVFNLGLSNAQSETVEVSNFSEVTISPFIEVVFKESNKESVVIEYSKVDRNKINIENDREELHIYLEDARIVSKEEEVTVNGREMDRLIYKGTEVRITVNYRKLDEVQIRGEERITFENPINAEDFDLDIYGSSKVYFKSITAEELKVAIYGESYLEVKGGKVGFQRYRCYGNSEVNTVDLSSNETKIAAYGDNHVVVNVSEKLKVSAIGEARIQYKGNAKVNSGLKIGETVIQKID